MNEGQELIHTMHGWIRLILAGFLEFEVESRDLQLSWVCVIAGNFEIGAKEHCKHCNDTVNRMCADLNRACMFEQDVWV